MDHSTPPPATRAKKDYALLRPTQKRERRKQLRCAIAEAEQQVGCPLEVITPPPTPSPVDLIHLPTSVREQIRTVRGLRIPSEKLMIRCKNLLATTHATETGTFASGAYITDPVRFVSVLCAQSPFLAVGGDSGGRNGQQQPLTKLGITYSIKGVQHFAPLMVYAGSDHWEDMNELTIPSLTPFTGDSAAFPHIWAVLQHLIDTRGAFLNGDWPFINAVLGLMSPSATHPCPICIIHFDSFKKSSRRRQPGDKHSIDRTHRPLLTIDLDRIVPTPLHLFLGISNRIILDAFSQLFSKELVEETLERVKTLHTPGCGGKSDVFKLNGPEIRKWLKKDCSSVLRTAAERKGSLTAEQKSTYTTLQRWLENLHKFLLHKKDWTVEEIEEWRAAVNDIQKHWCQETVQAAAAAHASPLARVRRAASLPRSSF
jgi:hypothetical protein